MGIQNRIEYKLISLFTTAISGSEAGLAITSTAMLTSSFQWGVRTSAELANNMTSVERVIEYSKLKPEAALESPAGN